MRILGIIIAVQDDSQNTNYLATQQYDLDHIGFMDRSSVKSNIKSFIKQIPTLSLCSRHTLQHENYVVYIQTHNLQPVVALAILDQSYYNERSMFVCLQKSLTAYCQQQKESWKVTKDKDIYCQEIKDLQSEFQNPDRVDAVAEAQYKMASVKTAIHKNLQNLVANTGQIEDIQFGMKKLAAKSRQQFRNAKEISDNQFFTRWLGIFRMYLYCSNIIYIGFGLYYLMQLSGKQDDDTFIMADLGIALIVVGILGVIGNYKTLKNKWWMAWYFFFNFCLFCWYLDWNVEKWNHPEIAIMWVFMVLNAVAAVFLWIFVNKGIDEEKPKSSKDVEMGNYRKL